MGRGKRKRKVAQEGLFREVMFELDPERWGKGNILRAEERVLKAGRTAETELGSRSRLSPLDQEKLML